MPLLSLFHVMTSDSEDSGESRCNAPPSKSWPGGGSPLPPLGPVSVARAGANRCKWKDSYCSDCGVELERDSRGMPCRAHCLFCRHKGRKRRTPAVLASPLGAVASGAAASSAATSSAAASAHISGSASGAASSDNASTGAASSSAGGSATPKKRGPQTTPTTFSQFRVDKFKEHLVEFHTEEWAAYRPRV
jgi:hypothetical protein